MIHDKHMNPVEADAARRDPAAPAPEEAQRRAGRLVSRRALVRAGWTVPVILALSHLPVNAFAQYACAHTDVAGEAHVDAYDGSDVHTDVPGQAHVDVDACA